MTTLAKRVDAHVGERVRNRRTELGRTQEHLAIELEISYQQVQKYETGANRISAGRLYQVARKLGIEVAYFFEGLNEGADAGPSRPSAMAAPIARPSRSRATSPKSAIPKSARRSTG